MIYRGDMNNGLLIVAILASVLLVLALGGITIAGVFTVRQARQWKKQLFHPDIAVFDQEISALREAHPEFNDTQLAQFIIDRDAEFAGLLGIAFGFGGILTFPFSLTIEVAMLIDRQIRMVELLSRIFARQTVDSDLNRLKAHALVLGSGHLGSIVQALLLRIIPKILLGCFPLIGGLSSFVVNWAMTQTIGKTCVKIFKGEKITGLIAILGQLPPEDQSVTSELSGTERYPVNQPPCSEHE